MCETVREVGQMQSGMGPEAPIPSLVSDMSRRRLLDREKTDVAELNRTALALEANPPGRNRRVGPFVLQDAVDKAANRVALAVDIVTVPLTGRLLLRGGLLLDHNESLRGVLSIDTIDGDARTAYQDQIAGAARL